MALRGKRLPLSPLDRGRLGVELHLCRIGVVDIQFQLTAINLLDIILALRLAFLVLSSLS